MLSSNKIGEGTYGQVFSNNDHDQEIVKVMKLFDSSDDFEERILNECFFLSTFTNIPFIPQKIKIEVKDKKLHLYQNHAK